MNDSLLDRLLPDHVRDRSRQSPGDSTPASVTIDQVLPTLPIAVGDLPGGRNTPGLSAVERIFTAVSIDTSGPHAHAPADGGRVWLEVDRGATNRGPTIDLSRRQLGDDE